MILEIHINISHLIITQHIQTDVIMINRFLSRQSCRIVNLLIILVKIFKLGRRGIVLLVVLRLIEKSIIHFWIFIILKIFHA